MSSHALRFQRSFIVRASISAVRAFHEAPEAITRLTPMPLRIFGAAPPVADGERIRFRLWVGAIPVRWTARYEAVSEDGFVDVMEEGPFASWRHEHRWRALPDGSTEVVDTIDATPRALASRLIWVGMKPAFAYRAWATRRALER